MRVSPFSQSQTVERKDQHCHWPHTPKKNGCFLGWSFFSCFGNNPVKCECPSPPKTDPLQQMDASSASSSTDKDQLVPSRSSLKKSTGGSVLFGGGNGDCIIRKKVWWPDECGDELFEIRHFQCQEYGIESQCSSDSTQQNGVPERKNRHLREVTRALLAGAKGCIRDTHDVIKQQACTSWPIKKFGLFQDC